MTPCAWAYVESFANLAGDVQLAAEAHSRRVGHPRREVLAGEVLHGQIRLSLVLAEVVDRDNVLVRQLPGGAGFAKEPLAAFLVGVNRSGDDLDRDDPLQQGILGAVHHAHATLAELFEEDIAADRRHRTAGPDSSGTPRGGWQFYRKADDNSGVAQSTSDRLRLRGTDGCFWPALGRHLRASHAVTAATISSTKAMPEIQSSRLRIASVHSRCWFAAVNACAKAGWRMA